MGASTDAGSWNWLGGGRSADGAVRSTIAGDSGRLTAGAVMNSRLITVESIRLDSSRRCSEASDRPASVAGRLGGAGAVLKIVRLVRRAGTFGRPGVACSTLAVPPIQPKRRAST